MYRHWQDRDGAGHIEFRDSFEITSRLHAIVEAETKRIFDEARRQERREPRHAYAADALAGLIERGAGVGAADGKPVNATVNVVIDHEAWQRGHARAGETCEVDGSGPVTVQSVREMATDAFLTLSTFDGTDVHRVARVGHRTDAVALLDSVESVYELLDRLGVDVQAIQGRGRHIPAHLRTALLIRDRTCVNRGCDVRKGLEIDHLDPVGWDVNGPTTYANTVRRCAHHHDQKTEQDRKMYGRGQWRHVGDDPP